VVDNGSHWRRASPSSRIKHPLREKGGTLENIRASTGPAPTEKRKTKRKSSNISRMQEKKHLTLRRLTSSQARVTKSNPRGVSAEAILAERSQRQLLRGEKRRVADLCPSKWRGLGKIQCTRHKTVNLLDVLDQSEIKGAGQNTLTTRETLL